MSNTSTFISKGVASNLTIASGGTLTKNVNPPHSNTEIVPPYSAIWSLNYSGALGATDSVSYKLYVTSLGIGSAFTLTSHQTGDYAVTAGNFLYDEYGTSIGIIKGNITIDNYMAKAAAVCGSLSNSIITAATYKGTWNAFTNTPTLTDGVGILGDAYDVTTSGTSGAYPEYVEQDWRIYDGSVWQRVDKTNTTEWTINPTSISGVNVDRAHFVHCTATSNTTTVRVTDENGGTLGEFYLHSIGDSITIEKSPSDYVVLVSGGVKAHAVGSPRS
jgi:hypothetical protein